MRKPWDTEFETQLLNALDYREFLKTFFLKNRNCESPRALTYQEFANRAGFSSKSFMKEVIDGKKKLSPNSLEKVKVGLKLNGFWSDYFEGLIGSEEPSFQTAKHSKEYYEEKLSKLKKKFSKLKDKKVLTSNSSLVQVFLETNFPEVYASLGDTDHGEEFNVIANRSKVETERLEAILQKMQESGLVLKKGNKYIPIAGALDISEIKSTEVYKMDFFRSIEKAKQRFQAQLSSDKALFMTQTFSVSESQLQEFKESLAILIEEFSAECESPQGDCVAEVVVSFTNNSKKP